MQDFSIQADVLDDDGNPFPIVVDGVRESHGTSCAGIIAMEKNSHCGVGVAYNSQITGSSFSPIHRKLYSSP